MQIVAELPPPLGLTQHLDDARFYRERAHSHRHVTAVTGVINRRVLDPNRDRCNQHALCLGH